MKTLAITANLVERVQRLRTDRGIWSRMARGSLWLGFGSGAENAMRVVRNMVLTRLIAPGAFAAMGIIMAINGAFEALTEIGIREAVIQNPRGGRRAYLNGAWWLAVARGGALFTVAWLAAPWAADFYQRPWLVPMMRVALLGILFNALISTRAYLALKHMRYRPWVIINQGGSLIGIVTALVLGIVLRSLWALVIGFAVEAAARCLLSHVVCPFRPGLRMDRESTRSLLRYVSGVFGVPILTLLYSKSDIFVLGKMVTDQELGLYTMATALAFIPDTLCTTVVAPVLMPALSSLQHDPERLLAHLLRTLKFLGLIFLPALTLMGCLAPQLLRVMYGPAYAAAWAPFALLCAAVAVRIMGWGLVTTFFATGRPELSRRASALRLAVLVAVIVPLVMRLGTAGAALAFLISGVAWAGLLLLYLRRIFGLGMSHCFLALSSGLGLSGLIAVTWLGAELLMPLVSKP